MFGLPHFLTRNEDDMTHHDKEHGTFDPPTPCDMAYESEIQRAVEAYCEDVGIRDQYSVLRARTERSFRAGIVVGIRLAAELHAADMIEAAGRDD